MDTITHTLFGLTLYGAVNKTQMTGKEKKVLLLTTLTGSQIPDIDVISSWWDTAGRYQMWHRGLTHSVFMVPVFAALLAWLVRIIFGLRSPLWFGIAFIAVWIHNTSDIFNAWGTGYFEPFTSVRLSIGTIPIVDFVFWGLMLGGFLAVRLEKRRWASHQVYRVVWALIAVHLIAQTSQGLVIVNEVKNEYEQVALSADFVPGVFTIVGKNGENVELRKGTVWTGLVPVATLHSAEETDLEPLFFENPKAETLYEWSPFVVIVNDGQRLGLYDPRFYRNGASFLFEYIDFPNK